MLNKLKLFFVAFKLLFDFIKKLFSNPDIEVHGDNNNININTSNNIRVDNSKHVSKNTTNNIVINEYYYPANIPSVSYSYTNRNDDYFTLAVVFIGLILSNNWIIYHHFLIFKFITIVLILTVIVCNLHIFFLCKYYISIVLQCFISIALSIFNAFLYINLKFIPKHLPILPIPPEEYSSYILQLLFCVSCLAFSILLIINYAKDIYAIRQSQNRKPNSPKFTIISSLVQIFIFYLFPIFNVLINQLLQVMPNQ